MKTFTVTMNNGDIFHSKADFFDVAFDGKILVTLTKEVESGTNIVDKFTLADVCSITSERN